MPKGPRATYLIDQLARTDAPVLAIGEPGTERVEVARSIHRKSTRNAHPLIIVDCVNGEQDEEGAFPFGPLGDGEFATGPCPTHSAFAKASNGTVVLHRVECLRQVAQRRLLDFMRRPFYQGETANCPQPLSRLMATTHPELKQQVEDGGFMRELFYRINILQARVPSLRECREDIPMLAQHFLDENGSQDGEGSSGPGLSLSSRAWLHLFQYDWPDNVDELRDLMGSLAQSAQGNQIEVDDLP